MAVRALQARVECGPEELQALWRTHRVFNERLPKLLSILFRMRRGECGESQELKDLYQRIAQFVLARGAQDGPYLLHAVSIKGWKPNTAKKNSAKIRAVDGTEIETSGASWADEAAALSAEGKLLYDKKELLGDLPGTLQQMVVRECVAVLRSHQELCQLWNEEHERWLKAKTDWEAEPEHRLYLALRCRFEAFERSVGGKAGKRRGRWHLYLDWLRSNPDLATWRGGTAAVTDLSEASKERIRKARPQRARAIEAEEFWKANPELAALDRLHGQYEREFVRRRKTKKNPDGFDHRPTFTLPDPVRHPRWFVFNAPQTDPTGYKDLSLPAKKGAWGSIKLLLVTGEKNGNAYPSQWKQLRFTSDPRMADFRPVSVSRPIRKGKSKGEVVESPGFVFYDRQLGVTRNAAISGVKLMFRDTRLKPDGSLLSAVPYLVFTCDIDDLKVTEGAKNIKWVDTGGKRKKTVVPAGTVLCAVDLGIRNIGFATVACRGDGDQPFKVLRSRNIWIGHEELSGVHPGRWSAGPDLSHLAHHKRKVRYLRRLRGKPVKGEESHIELQDHVTHMAEDRFKKAAREIVNFALNVEGRTRTDGNAIPRADVLILESLGNLLPDAERERGINRALIEFNRGHLVDRIKEVAKDCGLKVITITPVGTSQVCSRCGSLGRRYSIGRENGSLPDIHFGTVEKLFACPECGYSANADHNASLNLHRRFILGDSAVASYLEWHKKSQKDRSQIIETIEGELLSRLQRQHQLVVGDLPF